MIRQRSISILILILGGYVASCVSVTLANDSAASTAAGGIQLKREARISMEKERLTISKEKVTVEYEFLNETDQDITTEVAFPVPEYSFKFDDPGAPRDFQDFHLWIEGRDTPYEVETRAFQNSKDYTRLLQDMGIDIATFGHFDWDTPGHGTYQISRLPEMQRRAMSDAGLIDTQVDDFPSWNVRKTYHWMQVFPARKILHVRHEYTPVIGFTRIRTGDLDPTTREKRSSEARNRLKVDPKSGAGYYLENAKLLDDSCIDPALQKKLTAEATESFKTAEEAKQGDIIPFFWVDYILTTANSWKTPIRDFELRIERPVTHDRFRWNVSFCWDGRMERPDPDHFVARVSGFVPTKELHISFFSVDDGVAVRPAP